MNVKVKISVLLSIALLVGILIGFLVAPLLQRNFIERRIDNFRKPEMFIGKMIEVIGPDESRKEEIEKKLLAHHKRMIDFHTQIKTQMDSLRKDLESVLTPEQIERLDKMLRIGEPFRRKHRNDKGPFHKKPGYEKKSLRGNWPPPPPPEE